MNKERILVIEDEEDILALIHFNLVKAGFQVECAMTGEEGFTKVGRLPGGMRNDRRRRLYQSPRMQAGLGLS
jgi:CheY-like chemotaxis protein